MDWGLAAEGGVIAWVFVIFSSRSIIKTPLSYVILFLHRLGQVQTSRNTLKHLLLHASRWFGFFFFSSQTPLDKHFSLTLTGSASL